MSLIDKTIYEAGKCHIFALLALKYLPNDVTIKLLWDIEALDENMQLIPEPCLVHAYFTYNDAVFDINGYEQDPACFSLTYPCSTPQEETVTPEKLIQYIKDKKWGLPTEEDNVFIENFMNNSMYNLLEDYEETNKHPLSLSSAMKKIASNQDDSAFFEIAPIN